MSEIFVTTKMPVLALRGMTVFPEQTVHFDIGRVAILVIIYIIYILSPKSTNV